jgi:hypothetical protein
MGQWGRTLLILVTAIVILLFFALGMARLVACREIDTRRTVVLHLPPERIWQFAADIPAFLAAHARGRPILEITGWRVIHGDGRSPGLFGRYFASERIEARLLDIRLRSVKVALELDSRAQDRLAARAGVRRDDPLQAPAALDSPVLSAASRPFAHDSAWEPARVFGWAARRGLASPRQGAGRKSMPEHR